MKALPPGSSKQPIPHSHHRPPVDPKLKQPHSRPPSSHPPPNRAEPRDILREAARDSPFGIATKDYSASREHPNKSDNKDVQKSQREYLLKPNVAAETNTYGTNYNGDKQNRPPSSRTIDPNKVPIKHEQARRHEDKTFVKPESGDVKRHSVPGHDRNSSVYLNKSMNSTSQKVKSPFPDASKSVPKAGAAATAPPPPPPKQHHHNGTATVPYGAPIKEELLVKEEALPKEEPPNPVKKPSLFSPEKSPTDAKQDKVSPLAVKSSDSFSFPALSPLESPTNNSSSKRARNYSTGSEPELRPVMQKIDQVEGFENLMRDSTIGINKLHQIPDIITPITDVVKQEEPPLSFSKDMKPPDIIPPLCSDNISQPLVNGIETNPMLISNLLKETPSVPQLPVVVNSVQKTEPPPPTDVKDHTHHKSKKKNKEKHKHKDKDKSREDKEKKKKHKDKDREKHKHKEKHETATEPAEPIRIKIQKDKIQPVANPLKIKIPIPKDIKTEASGGESTNVPAAAPMALKIKIPREVMNNCNEVEKGRKRERERSSPGEAPPAKVARNSAHKDSKQNGRHSYNKVSNYSKNSAPPPTTYMPPPQLYQPQNMYYYPAQMGVVPTAGQPYIYPDGQMYNYYNGGFAYPPEIYQQAPPLPPGGSNPPLPMDAPPDIPPPPPPE